jgi:hypothetical protein
VSPRVVIGAPLYEHAHQLCPALDSLLAQTYQDFALVLIDDRSCDETLAIARAAAARDPRVYVEVNPRRLGMLGNTRRAFTLPLERFPDAEYWALASDHDVWAPRWLETLVGILDARPEAVLAYPQTRRIDSEGQEYPRRKPPWRFDSVGVRDPRARMRRAFRGMVAGDMIYGLFRVAPLRAVGTYRGVLIPDRLLLSELALHGEFAQAPEVLWSRRYRGLAELDRQRRVFWPEGLPLHARLPWWVQHAGAFAWTYAVRGKGAPLGIGRGAGARAALDYLEVSVRHRLWRRARRVRFRGVELRDRALGPPVRLALRSPAVRRLVRARVLPALDATEETLTRLLDSTDAAQP